MGIETPPNTDTSFETQFKKREHMDLVGGTAEVLDIGRETAEDDVPILLAPGWGGTLDLYKSAIKKLVEKEHRVVSLNHPHYKNSLAKRSFK